MRKALCVMSSRLPIGVATINNVPDSVNAYSPN
jgi:hypothetical protein